MNEVDVIIVGQGLAGSSLAYELVKRGQKVVVVDRGDEGSSSRVAAGLITPLTGKGLNPAWRQAEYLVKAIAHYQELEGQSGKRFYFAQPVLRLFLSDKEKQKWVGKEGPESCWAEAGGEIPEGLMSDHGSIKMPDGAWVDTVTYLSVVKDLLVKEGSFIDADFMEREVSFEGGKVKWRNVLATRIILCQGVYGLSDLGAERCESSSWFDDVEHRSAKGEILTLKIKNLDGGIRYHANGWLAPRGNGEWKAGASYDWGSLDSVPTEDGRKEVLARLRTWLSEDVDIDVVAHSAGVRPIIRSSRPVIAFHKERSEVGFFNGLGSKGTLMAPAVAEHLAMYLCGECELDEELALYGAAQSDHGISVENVTGSLLHCAHGVIKKVVQAGDTVVDATIGNGHDTLFLASCVGFGGKVVGFDIQEEALVSTGKRLNEAGVSEGRYELHQKSHAELANYLVEDVSAVMFNLGYLPSGDKEIITKVESTVEALSAAILSLRKGGVVSVMCYPGHPGGDTEAATVKAWFSDIHGDQYRVTLLQREGARETTPFLLIAEKS